MRSVARTRPSATANMDGSFFIVLPRAGQALEVLRERLPCGLKGREACPDPAGHASLWLSLGAGSAGLPPMSNGAQKKKVTKALGEGRGTE